MKILIYCKSYCLLVLLLLQMAGNFIQFLLLFPDDEIQNSFAYIARRNELFERGNFRAILELEQRYRPEVFSNRKARRRWRAFIRKHIHN
jgi:hypothetical protein